MSKLKLRPPPRTEPQGLDSRKIQSLAPVRRLAAQPPWGRHAKEDLPPRPWHCWGAVLAICVLLFAGPARAGVDVSGPAARMQVAADGTLWFAMETETAVRYCRQGWWNLNMYVPKSHPEYPYYYGILLAAVSKGKSIYVANIGVFDGTGPCDITKTGYGLVLLQ